MKHQKGKFLRRSLGACLVLLLTVSLTTPAFALFGKSKQTAASPSEGAPVAQNLAISTYQDIPITGTFTTTAEGDVTYALQTEPKSGSVTIEEGTANFKYIPKEGKTGKDSFAYVAIDSEGRVSAPATVTVTIDKNKSKVTYEDMSASPDHAAAIRLAESGVYTGMKVGDDYFFGPDETVSRSEFLAMAMKATDVKELSEVTMTGFCDDGVIPTWAKSYASAALKAGIIDGVDTQEGVAFDASSAISLGEAATIMNRILDVTNVVSPGPTETEQAMANLQSVGVISAGCFGSSTVETPMTRAAAAEMLTAAMNVTQADEGGGLLDWLK
ncbi:MAG: surface layer protein [Clostridiales bacterium]|nr:surface layer protein [Clostridiales bacterium]